ncbi:MAG: type II toxin-antitoxin system HicA family toxin [Capsulimonadaceae bacterium]
MLLSGSEFCKILKSHGFEFDRQKGSHASWQRRHDDTTTTVVVPMVKEIPKGTLVKIIRQSRLPRSLFESE